jgi:hypothetical protein
MQSSIKRLLSYTLATLSLGLAIAPARAVSALSGSMGEIVVTAETRVAYESNIFMSSGPAVSDSFATIAPGLEFVSPKGGLLQGVVTLSEQMVRYQRNSQLNSNLSAAGVRLGMDDGRSKLAFAGSFVQTAQNTVDTRLAGALVKRDTTSLDLKGETGFTAITNVGAGANYVRTHYRSGGFTDNAAWTLPLDIYYHFSAKLDLSAGYQFRDNHVTGPANDSRDHFFNVGARGTFSPLLTGQVRVGYTSRNPQVGETDDLFGVDSEITYEMTPKSHLRINIGNDFAVAGTGDTTRNTSYGLFADSKISSDLTVTGGVNYRTIRYTARTDDYIEGVAGVSCALNRMISANVEYTYRHNHSSVSKFTDHVVSAGAKLRF